MGLLPMDEQGMSDKNLVAQYEKVKRVLRQVLDPAYKGKDPRFILACEACGLPFADDSTVGVLGAHWAAEHVPADTPEDSPARKVRLDLLYIETGMPPKGKGGK